MISVIVTFGYIKRVGSLGVMEVELCSKSDS